MNGYTSFCKLMRSVPVDDGFGGVTETSANVCTSLACRRSRVFDEQHQGKFGVGGRELWRFSTPPLSAAVKKIYGQNVKYVIGWGTDLYDVQSWIVHPNQLSVADHIEFQAEIR